MSSAAVVIVGAGHAGVQAAASLREEGFDGDIVLLSAESGSALSAPAAVEGVSQGRDGHPWPAAQGRSPLSRPAHRPEARRRRNADRSRGAAGRAQRRRSRSLTAISSSRPARGSGGSMSRASTCRACSRCATSPTRPRSASASSPGRKVVIIGAGFIGLEIAATATSLGAEATVVEIARPMGRAVSPIMSDFFLKAHAAFGARFRLGVGVAAIKGRERAETVVLTDGEGCARTSSSSAVGVVAEDALARASGLECANGVVVDEHLRTSDPGDFGDRRLRRLSQRGARLPHPARIGAERRRSGALRRRASRRQARAL